MRPPGPCMVVGGVQATVSWSTNRLTSIPGYVRFWPRTEEEIKVLHVASVQITSHTPITY